MAKVYQSGNTIRLECTFYDFDEKLIDPALISLRLYDAKYVLISTYSVGIGNRLSKGRYHYDYVAPMTNATMWYEWYAEIDGLPSLEREQFKISFDGR